MINLQLGVAETRFAELVWAYEPLSTKELVTMCEAEFQWKKTTTYTVLKRLCDKGLFINESGAVKALISKADFCSARSEQFVQETFAGSLPAFLAAFTAGKSLTREEVDFLRKMVDDYEVK